MPQCHAQSPSRTSLGGARRMPLSAGPTPAGEGAGASHGSGRPYPLLNCSSGSSGSGVLGTRDLRARRRLQGPGNEARQAAGGGRERLRRCRRLVRRRLVLGGFWRRGTVVSRPEATAPAAPAAPTIESLPPRPRP